MNDATSQKQRSKKTSNSRADLIEQYVAVRNETTKICSKLQKEDHAIQPCAEVSPPKWHLSHTTWFFEEMILAKSSTNYSRFNDRYRVLFNSYYKAASEHWIQADRGQLSRPLVDEILNYREYVDEHLIELLQNGQRNSELDFILNLGIHHEQQHQELLYMDIKYILGVNPLVPTYTDNSLPPAAQVDEHWQSFEEGVYEIGHDGEGFSYDNERPQHKTYIHPFRISKNTVTNGSYLEFMEDQGYDNPQYWLSQGWDWVNNHKIGCPLYWRKEEGEWYEFTLHGLQSLDLQAPVSHVSYFEAYAFANWQGARLPTEQEFEIYLDSISVNSSFEQELLHPNRVDRPVGQVWQWTKSHYSSYPGFRTFKGMLGEYNGKFMCNQFVLKAGCIATPKSHYRHSYRNFYQPHQRWMFSGIRLAKDELW